MKYKIIAVLIAALLSGCIVTEKQKARFLNKYCKGKDSISVVETTRLKDTTIYITTPGPIQYLDSPCDSLGRLKPINKKEKKNGLTSTVKTLGNSIVFDCEADSLKQVITTLEKERAVYKANKIVIKEDCTRKHRTEFDIVCRWGFLVLLGAIGLRFAIRKYL